LNIHAFIKFYISYNNYKFFQNIKMYIKIIQYKFMARKRKRNDNAKNKFTNEEDEYIAFDENKRM